MIENNINNYVSIAIFLLYIIRRYQVKKKLKMVLEMKFQEKTRSKRCDCAMQKSDSEKVLLL